MKRTIISILLAGCLLLTGGRAAAQDLQKRPITRATLYGAGFTNVFDTYLSPQEYTGVEFRLSRESMRTTRWGNGRFSRQVFFEGNVGYTHNRVDNNNMLSALVHWSYGVHHHFPITENFRLLAGAMGDVNGGFVYNLRNGNNPAQARAYANLAASGMAIWKVRIKNYPITLRYQLEVPLMGLMFSPHYGQSYYEIFSLGHGGGVVKFTSLHNRPSLRQRLTADFPVRRATLRLGYTWDAQQAQVNGLKSHAYSHIFMVGFVKKFCLINPDK